MADIVTFTCPGMVASLRSSSLKLTQTVEVKLPMPPSSSSSVKLEQSEIFLFRSKIINMMNMVIIWIDSRRIWMVLVWEDVQKIKWSSLGLTKCLIGELLDYLANHWYNSGNPRARAATDSKKSLIFLCIWSHYGLWWYCEICWYKESYNGVIKRCIVLPPARNVEVLYLWEARRLAVWHIIRMLLGSQTVIRLLATRGNLWSRFPTSFPGVWKSIHFQCEI